MVQRGAGVAEHRHLPSGFHRRGADHVQELASLSHGRAASAREQEPPRPDASQGSAVELQVLVARALQMQVRRSKLGGVEDDDVEGFTVRDTFQHVIQRRLALEMDAIAHVVELGVLEAQLYSGKRLIDGHHGPRPGLGRVDGEPARVAEGVEHVAPLAQLRHHPAVVALVAVVPRLLPLAQHEAEAHAVLLDHHRRELLLVLALGVVPCPLLRFDGLGPAVLLEAVDGSPPDHHPRLPGRR
mmetsp:Transcript_35066/g.92333  ORF Transcript_35066/g.92333 Transcript_35066/m.92333 type:complete len:242 (+) Transcript_35066:141-866(+)